MSDVGLDRLIPEAYRSMGYLREADLAYWEALYTDGTVVRETDGTRYEDIDRDRLDAFRIIHHGEIMVEVRPPAGATGRDFVYRRRTIIAAQGGGRAVWFILGFAPMGPVLALSLDEMKLYEAEGFTAENGVFNAPIPLPSEPADMLGVEE